MKTYSYEKCQTCIVKACCSIVCRDYKQYIYEAIALNILPKQIALDRCEQLIQDPPIKLDNKTFAIVDGVRVISGSYPKGEL